MKLTRTIVILAAAALLLASTAGAEDPRLNPGRGRVLLRPALPVEVAPKKPADPQVDLMAKLNQADAVFTGTVANVRQGPTAMSYPPIYTLRITFSDIKALKGKADAKTVYNYQSRQKKPPKVDVGAKLLVAVKITPAKGRMPARASITNMVPADAHNLKLATTAVKLPIGWSIKDGKPLSPFAPLGKKAWPKGAKPKGDLVCSKTGRPGLLCGPKVTFATEWGPPVKAIKWQNPDGDGVLKITVTNPTDKPLKVPALLADEKGKILWEDSLVVLWKGKPLLLPGAGKVPVKVKPVTLKPRQILTAEINILKLGPIAWPRGGYRIHLRFCLGEKSVERSFYYYSKHHDKLREKVQPAKKSD